MIEVPVFVPHGREALASVLAIPDGKPRGCVVLTTGVGAPRSHRFSVWSKTAERLANVGIASIRWDYLGLHDSTGEVPVVQWSDDLVRQTLAVATFAKRVLGVDRMAAAGNCLGARLALRAAADMDGSVGAICMLPPVLERRWFHRLLRQLGASRSGRGWIPRMLRRVGGAGSEGNDGRHRPGAALLRLKDLAVRTDPTMEGPFRRALRTGRVLFLFGDADLIERGAAMERLGRLIRRLPPDAASRCEVRTLTGGTLVRLGSVQIQRETIDTVAEWMDARFSDAP
jgi:pimeloyl-ACP methyl ester carboxylesterase